MNDLKMFDKLVKTMIKNKVEYLKDSEGLEVKLSPLAFVENMRENPTKFDEKRINDEDLYYSATKLKVK